MFKELKNSQITRYTTSKETINYSKTSAVDLQKESFQWFLTEGLAKITEHYQNRKGKLRLKSITLTPPRFSETECLEQGLSYDAQITFFFASNNTDVAQEYLLSAPPLHYMTKSGTFIVKGKPRVFIASLASKSSSIQTKDRDQLQHKNILLIGYILYQALFRGLQDFFTKVYRAKDPFSKLASYFESSIRHHMGSVFNQFNVFETLDTCNPLAMLSHLNMVTSQGIYGVPKHSATYKVRDIHSSHYGRLCPIETPEGQNTGLIHHLASYVTLKEGQLLTPYKIVENGKVTEKIVELTAEEEKDAYIVQAAEPISESNTLIASQMPARHQGKIAIYAKELITHQDIARGQILGTAASLIPFLEHDDGHRAVMAASMQKQAVPLVNPEAPIIATGEEAFVAKQAKLFPYLPQDYANTKGELALGKNLLVAYLPWEGYNYEDAVVVSSELVDDDILTSLEQIQLTCALSGSISDNSLDKFTCHVPGITKENQLKLDKYGFIKVGATVYPGDIIVGKLSPVMGTTELISYKLFGAPEAKNTSLIANNDTSGKVIAIKFLDQEGNITEAAKAQMVIITLEQKQKLTLGDKLAGRHGNKGVVAKIVPKEKMPRLKSGEHIQILLNPLGIPSRMNVGQLYEAHLGFISKLWADKIKAGDKLTEKLIPYFKGIPDIMEYRKNAYAIPMAIPPFNAPSLKEIQSLYELLGLDTSLKTELINSETNEPFAHPVTVGITYMLKLHHMVEDKIHARSTGKYAQLTEQPLQGRGNMGGQRMGEMEMWALEGHGAIHNLQEFLTIKSDDVSGRLKIIDAILNRESMDDYGIPEAFKYLVKLLNALALNVTVIDNTGKTIVLDELKEHLPQLTQEEKQND